MKFRSIFVEMLKRRVIALFICLAFVMLQVHNFTPHQHQAEHQKEHVHDHDDHHHPEQDSENGQDSPFSDITHHADFEKTVIQPKTTDEALIQLASLVVDLPTVFRLFLAPANPPPKLFPPQDQHWSPLYTCPSISHRGPPAFIVEA